MRFNQHYIHVQSSIPSLWIVPIAPYTCTLLLKLTRPCVLLHREIQVQLVFLYKLPMILLERTSEDKLCEMRKGWNGAERLRRRGWKYVDFSII